MSELTATLSGRHTRPDGAPHAGTVLVVPEAPLVRDLEGGTVYTGAWHTPLDEDGAYRIPVRAYGTADPAHLTYSVQVRLADGAWLEPVRGIIAMPGADVDVTSWTTPAPPDFVPNVQRELESIRDDAALLLEQARLDLDAALVDAQSAVVEAAASADTATAASAAAVAADGRAQAAANDAQDYADAARQHRDTAQAALARDSGTRDLASAVALHPSLSALTFVARRLGSTVMVSANLRCDTALAAGVDVFTLPPGFRPALIVNSSPPYAGAGSLALQSSGPARLWTALMPGETRAWTWTWLTTDAWPATLPGAPL